MRSTDVTDSPLVHSNESLTVADEIAFDGFTDEQKRVARLVLHEEITEQVYVEMEMGEDELGELRGEYAALVAKFNYLRGEGIERIYKNDKGFWLYPKNPKGEINYDPYKSTGPYTTLEAAVDAGTK